MSRMFAPCPWPLPMRPPGTATGPLPFAPAMAPLEAWCRRSREVRREICGVLEAKAEAGGFSWWEKGPCGRCCGGGRSRWWGASARSEFGWLVGEKVVMALARCGTAVRRRHRSQDSERGSRRGIRGKRLISLALGGGSEKTLAAPGIVEQRQVAYGGVVSSGIRHVDSLTGAERQCEKLLGRDE